MSMTFPKVFIVQVFLVVDDLCFATGLRRYVPVGDSYLCFYKTSLERCANSKNSVGYYGLWRRPKTDGGPSYQTILRVRLSGSKDVL